MEELNKQVLETLEGPLNFVMDFRAVKKLDKRFGHQEAGRVFKELMNTNSKEFTDCVMKVLSCCCVDKDLQAEELEKILTPDITTFITIDNIAYKLLMGFLGEQEDKKK